MVNLFHPLKTDPKVYHLLKDDIRKSRVGPNSQRIGEIEDSVLGASPRLYRAPLFRVVRVGNTPQFFLHRLWVS